MKNQEEKKMLDDYYHYDYPYIKPEKSAIDTANDLLASKCLINLYHTMGMASHTDPSKYIFSLILDIKDMGQFLFSETGVIRYCDTERLQEFTAEELNLSEEQTYRNEKIEKFWQDMYGDWTLKLANNVIIEIRNINYSKVYVGQNYF